MNNIKIKYISAKNFLCFGPEGIEIDFEDFGNITLVRGDNLDIDPDNEEERRASNGVGKSSIPEIIVFALFGKTIKLGRGAEHVVNNQIGKKLRVEIVVDNYRIVRQRSPNTLKVWESAEGVWNKETELSLGGMTDTQKWIEDKLGLNFNTFCHLVVFTDNNSGCFLESDTGTRREIVENMLYLDVYRQYHEVAKKLRNLAKETTKTMGSRLELMLAESESCKRRIKSVETEEQNWRNSKTAELNAIISRYKTKETELQNTDIGQALTAYKDAQEKLAELNEALPSKEEKLQVIKESLEKARHKQDSLSKTKDRLEESVRATKRSLADAQDRIAKNKTIINDTEARRCLNCGHVDELVLERTKKDLKDREQQAVELETVLMRETGELSKYTDELKGVVEIIKMGDVKSREISSSVDALRKEIGILSKIERPEISTNEKIIEDQLNELKTQILKRKEELDGPSPYVKILETTIKESEDKVKECESKKAELDAANAELPYYEFWVTAFGDKGIRKFIIEGIIPALNARIEYWLQFLIDGKIKLTFNNELEPTITRNPVDGDSFVYYALSGGERRRTNLAVSQAFAHVMTLNCGTCPSVVFLDEVTTNIDPIGVQGVYNMIMELAKERQVFITTHDHDLLEMLRVNGCESINLVKQGGFTTIK